MITKSAATLLTTIVLLAASAAAQSEAPESRLHVDFLYQPYAPDAATGRCGAPPSLGQRAAVGGIFLSWLAGKIVDGFREAAEKRVKQYAGERASEPQYLRFYQEFWADTPSAWTEKGRLSCFEFSQRECRVPLESHELCNGDSRLTIRGSFLVTPGYLKAIPTYVAVTGIAAERKPGSGATAAMAATLALDAVWLDGSRGRKERIFETVLFKQQYPYRDAKQVLLPEVVSADDLARAFAAAEPLPRPPEVAAAPTMAAVSARVAEAGQAPPLLRWIAEFLADKKDDLSAALAAALDAL